jgi:hypothetical protein
VQAWDFIPGRDWAHEMQHATATAERVIAVLSPSYLASAFAEAEWRAFYASDPTGERNLLLPVRVAPVEPPGLLKTRVYVDLTNRDAATARAELLAAARSVGGKPTTEPEFPGAPARQVDGEAGAPRFPGELPPIWNVPYHPNPYFTGRNVVLAEVHTRLTAPEADSRRVALTGLGGAGKTQLAVEFAYRHRADYDLVWWVRGEQPMTLLGDYAALAAQPSIAADMELTPDSPQDEVIMAVRAWLDRHHRWLLILDSVDDPSAVGDLLPNGLTGHVLITSRSAGYWEPLATEIQVEVLTPSAAAAFLLARTHQVGSEAAAAATTLATMLGGLPLALVLQP